MAATPGAQEHPAVRRQFLTPAQREALNGWFFALPWLLGLLVFTLGC